MAFTIFTNSPSDSKKHMMMVVNTDVCVIHITYVVPLFQKNQKRTLTYKLTMNVTCNTTTITCLIQ